MVKEVPLFFGSIHTYRRGHRKFYPLRFLLNINDMPFASSLLKFHLFADDASIFYSHENLKHMENIASNEFYKVSIWLTANKLTLNIEKSNFLIISPPQKSPLAKLSYH